MTKPIPRGDPLETPAWLVTEPPAQLRWRMTLRLAWRMALHDRQQSIAAILGVAFAYFLVGQNVGSGAHYLAISTAYIDANDADMWIVPPGEKAPVGTTGSLLSTSPLHQASVTRGVDRATPIVRGYTPVTTPDGAAETVFVIGIPGPTFEGGPFNIVKGERADLAKPNALFVDDYAREKLGGLNVGSQVEVAGHRVRIEGLTWGLVTINGPFAFAEYDFARTLLEMDYDRCSLVMVKLDGTVDPARVKSELQYRVPEARVLTSDEYRLVAWNFILFETGLAGLIVMGFAVGVTVGMAIVTLAMISAVQQNLREYGTLKAIGATNSDLRRVLTFQAIGYSLLGSFVGAALLCQVAWAARLPQLNMVLQPSLLLGLIPGATLMAVIAALVSLRRINRVDPASVFR